MQYAFANVRTIANATRALRGATFASPAEAVWFAQDVADRFDAVVCFDVVAFICEDGAEVARYDSRGNVAKPCDYSIADFWDYEG